MSVRETNKSPTGERVPADFFLPLERCQLLLDNLEKQTGLQREDAPRARLVP